MRACEGGIVFMCVHVFVCVLVRESARAITRLLSIDSSGREPKKIYFQGLVGCS
jgi:hypothetical protein